MLNVSYFISIVLVFFFALAAKAEVFKLGTLDDSIPVQSYTKKCSFNLEFSEPNDKYTDPVSGALREPIRFTLKSDRQWTFKDTKGATVKQMFFPIGLTEGYKLYQLGYIQKKKDAAKQYLIGKKDPRTVVVVSLVHAQKKKVSTSIEGISVISPKNYAYSLGTIAIPEFFKLKKICNGVRTDGSDVNTKSLRLKRKLFNKRKNILKKSNTKTPSKFNIAVNLK